MFNIEIDEEKLTTLYLEKVEEHLQDIETEMYFMNSKQLATYLNLSWNSICTHFLDDEDFPKLESEANGYLIEERFKNTSTNIMRRCETMEDIF